MKTNNLEKNILLTLLFCCFTIVALPSLAMAEDDHDEEEEHEGGPIELTQEQIEHADIGLAKVSSGRIRDILPLYGEIAANAERVQSVSARFEGVIRDVTKSVGDAVKKGETLVTVEANESLKSYSVASALTGTITQRNANVGEQTTDKTLMVVEDFSTVWVELSLFPKDVSKVHLGQQVRIKGVESGKTADGSVIYIAPFSTGDNQAISARVVLDNPERYWVPGLFISAEVTLAEAVFPLVVRNEALQIVEGNDVVFVKGEEGFEPRPVSLGRTDGEFSEVVRGLHENEIYVSRNSFLLKAELGKGDIEDDD